MPRIKKIWVPLTPENFKVGLKCRVSPTVKWPRAGWGFVDHSCVGIITSKLHRDRYFIVDFETQYGWSAYLTDMEILV